MTVSELAMSAQRDIDDVIEAISFSDSLRRYNENTVIEDQNILHDVIRKLGAKFKIIPRPDSKVEKETKDVDAVKRY